MNPPISSATSLVLRWAEQGRPIVAQEDGVAIAYQLKIPKYREAAQAYIDTFLGAVKNGRENPRADALNVHAYRLRQIQAKEKEGEVAQLTNAVATLASGVVAAIGSGAAGCDAPIVVAATVVGCSFGFAAASLANASKIRKEGRAVGSDTWRSLLGMGSYRQAHTYTRCKPCSAHDVRLLKEYESYLNQPGPANAAEREVLAQLAFERSMLGGHPRVVTYRRGGDDR